MTSIISIAVDGEHAYSLASPATLAASDVIDNSTEECAELAGENIVFADLHIIQSIINLVDNNNTGALDQLSLAQEQLNKAQSRQPC